LPGFFTDFRAFGLAFRFPIGLCGLCGVESMRFSAASRRRTASCSLYSSPSFGILDMSKRPRQSPLENFPKYTQALGLIAIELATLEFELSDMLGYLLRLDRQTAKAIYFTPNSSRARMETLLNALESVLAHTELLKSCRRLVKRGLGILDKRNNMLHDIWGLDEKDFTTIILMKFPEGRTKPLALETLTTMVHDLRVLADEVAATRRSLIFRPHYRINATYKIGPKNAD
jgi:hypothetical protein